MKAILVIDFPDDYGDVNDNKAIVTLRNGKLGTSLGIYNVPLKPLPTKITTATLSEKKQESTELFTEMALLKTYADGWNDCLKEITDD